MALPAKPAVSPLINTLILLFTLILGIFLITYIVSNSYVICKKMVSRFSIFYSPEKCEIDPRLVELQFDGSVMKEATFTKQIGFFGRLCLPLLFRASTFLQSNWRRVIIKEQRIDDSCIMTRSFYKPSMLRYILTGFERNYQIRIPSRKINRQIRLYSKASNINKELETPILCPALHQCVRRGQGKYNESVIYHRFCGRWGLL